MTPTELRFAALRETRVVGLSETPAAEQGVLAADQYAGLHAQLVDDELASWAITEDIPAAVQQPMIMALAYLCATQLGAADEDIQRLYTLGAFGVTPMSKSERQIRKYAAQKYVSQPLVTEYF